MIAVGFRRGWHLFCVSLDARDTHGGFPRAGRQYNRAYVWSDREAYGNAISDYKEAIRLDPNDAMACLKRGNARWAKKEYRKAVSDYDTAIRFGIRSLGPGRERAMTLRRRVN